MKGTQKVGGGGGRKKEKGRALPLPSFLPIFFFLFCFVLFCFIFFSCTRFLDSADATFSEPGTYESRGGSSDFRLPKQGRS